MRAVRLSFFQMLSYMRRDRMLMAVCAVPVFLGPLIRFGVPALERALTGYLSAPEVIAPYYGLFDISLAMLTALMFCYAAAMVILEERDDRLSGYLFVTPLGRTGYLISRLGLPWAFAVSAGCILLLFFGLTRQGGWEILLLSVSGSLQGVIVALLIVTLSANKLEGMAVTKLSSLTVLAVLAPYFVPVRIQYAMSLLPSLWIGKAVRESSLTAWIASAVLSLFWTALLLRRFLRKLA